VNSSGSRRLSILFVGPLPPMRGGSANVCVQILDGLADLGHRIRTLAAVTPETQRAAEEFADRHPWLSPAWFPMPYFDPFPNAAPTDYREREGAQIRQQLRSLIEDERPDVLVIGREIFAWHAPDVALAHAIPSLMIVHGGPSTQIVHGTYPKALVRPMLDQIRKVDVVVAVAEHWARALRGLGLDNVRHIANPVDLRRFAPTAGAPGLRSTLAIGEHETVVLHASNLLPGKRLTDLIGSAERALPHNPKLVYVILGPGAAGEALDLACRERGVRERFRFVDWVEHERMADYLNLADMVVMPSESETQALMYLETQACARLLLASDIAAAREVVRDGATGLLFAMGDVADLAAKTLLAARDPGLRVRIGRAARAYVEQHHGLPDAVTCYAALLEELVQSRAGPRPPTLTDP
jgi:glycosyltransferase involved in cell wall biosynthesis